MASYSGTSGKGAASGSSQQQQQQQAVIMALPTTALEIKLRNLKEQSQKHSQSLTQKLATSQSGQNLLHIGTSLSTLPPDLHSLLTQLHPLLSATEAVEKELFTVLQNLVACANTVRLLQRRVDTARDCAQLYQELQASERNAQRDKQSTTASIQLDNEDGILGTYVTTLFGTKTVSSVDFEHSHVLSRLDSVIVLFSTPTQMNWIIPCLWNVPLIRLYIWYKI